MPPLSCPQSCAQSNRWTYPFPTLPCTATHALQPVYLQPNVRILSTGASALNGFLGRGQGVVLPAGAYTRPLQFGLLGGVADFALKIQVNGRAGGKAKGQA